MPTNLPSFEGTFSFYLLRHLILKSIFCLTTDLIDTVRSEFKMRLIHFKSRVLDELTLGDCLTPN